jgi:23S rRNA (cytidine1920-2'-O)/16S rRNA (cytidine1409-2'-O)-methyltransferase
MKLRADVLLVERGLAPSRTQAQALILAGRVYSGERRIEKAGDQLREDIELEVRGGSRFVSRGGDKLAGALEALQIDVSGSTCVDVGASTGGFTDCLLQLGATKVYAVDVGHGQLAQKLREHSAVVNMERTNARNLETDAFDSPIDLVVVDASFIGLDKLMPAIARFSASGSRLVALVKPQFEAGREAAARGRGVIRDPAVREAAIARARDAILEAGYEILAEHDSTVRGPKGNLERFVYARKAAREAEKLAP